MVDTLTVIAQSFPRRLVALVRELTKLHEEVLRGPASELVDELVQREAAGNVLKGECVIVIAPPSADELRQIALLLSQTQGQAVSFEEAAQAGLAAGEAKTVLAKRLAKQYGLPKSDAYSRILELSDN